MGLDLNRFPIGQNVTVRETSHYLQITPSGKSETGLKVIEVGRDHLVLEDTVDGNRKSIPLYLIQETASLPVESSATE